MQKKLIALALASAFAAPAFAATANVDVYGAFRGSVDFVDADGTNNESRTRVSSNNSRIGFKGTEDLGGGLSAIWQWEYAFQLDQQGSATVQANNDSQGTNSHRNTFVGLSSKTLGALTIGTQESPLKTSTGPLAVFGDTLADYRSVFTKLSTRSDNSVLYTSPNMSGLVLQAMYGMRNEAGNGSNPNARMYALSGVYQNGPLYATLAYENNKNTRNAAAGAGAVDGVVECFDSDSNNDGVTDATDLPTNFIANFAFGGSPAAACAAIGGLGTTVVHIPRQPTAAVAAVASLSSTVAAWRAGVGYTFGSTKLGLAYEKNDAENLNGVTTNDGHAWYASVAHKMGNVTLNAAYTDRSEYTDGADNGAKQWTVGADYAMSKRTSVYALYTRVNNDTNGTNNIGAGTGIATVSTVAGGDASGFSLGVNHSF